MRRRLGAVSLLCLAAATLTTGARSLGAQESDTPHAVRALLAQARSGRGNFSGVVQIDWQEPDGDARSERVRVQRRGATITVAGDRDVVGSDADRFVDGSGGWISIGGVPPGAELPDFDAEWELQNTGERPFVANVRTFEVEAVDRDTGSVRQRLYLAPIKPYLFKRETLDTEGNVLRAFELVRWRPVAGGVVASPPHDYETAEPDPLAALPSDALEEVGDGYQLVSAYELDDDVVHLFYSDGLFGVSVFVDEGELDADALPSGATTRDVDGEDVRAYATASGDVLVWEDEDDRVLAWVSDAPPDALAGVAASFTGDDEPSLWGRAADVVLGPFAWG